MNLNPDLTGQHRIAREECEVGDWVDAIVAHEWLEQEPSHVFLRAQISISPVEGGMGGVLPDQQEEFTFVAGRRDRESVWIRES